MNFNCDWYACAGVYIFRGRKCEQTCAEGKQKTKQTNLLSQFFVFRFWNRSACGNFGNMRTRNLRGVPCAIYSLMPYVNNGSLATLFTMWIVSRR